jgi:hypothetical protein
MVSFCTQHPFARRNSESEFPGMLTHRQGCSNSLPRAHVSCRCVYIRAGERPAVHQHFDPIHIISAGRIRSLKISCDSPFNYVEIHLVYCREVDLLWWRELLPIGTAADCWRGIPACLSSHPARGQHFLTYKENKMMT